MFFSPESIHYAGPDGFQDRHRYRVELPNLSYDGIVTITGLRHAAGDTEQWIAEQLDHRASRGSYEVLCGQLYSPVHLEV